MKEGPDPQDEHPLEGGNITAGVVRVGDTVRRPRAASWQAIHALLRHLERVGFAGSPKVLGIDEEGREILTFHHGVTTWPDTPDLLDSDDNLARAARLVRDFHRASASFTPPRQVPWWQGSIDPIGGDLVLHGDLAPWNLVAGEEWVIIDWDSASPGRVEWELAYVLHTFVPLWHNSGLSDAETVRRISVFVEAYELQTEELRRALELVPARIAKVATFMREAAAIGDPAFVTMVEEGHDLSWLTARQHVLERLPVWTRRVL
jgi:hypothetical protein